ncbi:Phage T7 exclusion protein [Cystobacter fuscus DSM 2262]|uniref:Phage T7 exclusion protein n=1 Tax=Cystobacter fuscus (strain ATCC 25194 / DSM 2262 / NBRC 100088 / M29) TaxID=1242864 RepID=S9P5H8_CYSF2|nr:Qat anti-phage system ATPase QatA [Cystobacter fuscus]EPX59690.1 Phage T7 exclusion protein [Cystobacter fuscus DSM 2262]
MLLTDNETKVDLLNNEAIAATIVTLLRDRPDRPVTIGVHGDWGAGKSSILEMIETGLEEQDGVLCLKFNGWRFQGFEDAKIALIEGIVTALIEKRPMLNKAVGAVKDVFKRIDWLKLAKKGGGLAWTAFTGIPTPEQIQAVVATVEGLLADPMKLATKENVESALGGVKSLLKPETETKNVPEEVHAFHEAFDKLLKAASVKQLVVLIDDLDRCLPDTAIETLEAIRLFVFTERTAFIVAADEAMIEYAVRKHFPDLPDTTGPRDYARNYLEKLIQVPFRIPALGETETRVYVTLLLIGAELGENDEGYEKLIIAAREKLKRPWESTGLDAATVNEVLGARAAQAHNALTLSDQIGPILATGAKGNPRLIKRFLNTLLLRQSTAEARGFGSEVKLPVLAKLMLAERFQSRLFDQIASAAAAHPKGRCEDLAAIETMVEDEQLRNATASAEKSTSKKQSGDGNSKKPSGDGKDGVKFEVMAKPTAESAVLSEWLASEPVRAWARVRPSLADVDLRPYLFVTKDRKDYFGAASALGHLAPLVEQLLGPKLMVQARESDLRQITLPEAARIFEALRSRIMGDDSFDQEPPGVAGLTVLVRTHPVLQSNLLDFLEALPRERCGVWPVKGWEGIIKDGDAIARLDKLLAEWSAMPKNSFLKSAAANALRARRGGR